MRFKHTLITALCVAAVSIYLAGTWLALDGKAHSPTRNSATRAAQNAPDRSDACFMSQKFVKQNLKAPSTAEFPAWTEANCKATYTNGTWKVRSFVDAQNGFGAMLRSDYGLEMRYNPATDTWTLLDIMIVNP